MQRNTSMMSLKIALTVSHPHRNNGDEGDLSEHDHDENDPAPGKPARGFLLTFQNILGSSRMNAAIA
jgi:hypothetical protein